MHIGNSVTRWIVIIFLWTVSKSNYENPISVLRNAKIFSIQYFWFRYIIVKFFSKNAQNSLNRLFWQAISLFIFIVY